MNAAFNEYTEPGELVCLMQIPPEFKPRLRLHLHIWHCASRKPRVIGYGYTPKAAYEEWQTVVAERREH